MLWDPLPKHFFTGENWLGCRPAAAASLSTIASNLQVHLSYAVSFVFIRKLDDFPAYHLIDRFSQVGLHLPNSIGRLPRFQQTMDGGKIALMDLILVQFRSSSPSGAKSWQTKQCRAGKAFR